MFRTALLLFAPFAVCAADPPPLPDKEGFAGSFAGVSHEALVVAGGANFPDKRPWEGGTKVWYDSVFVLDKPDGKWKAAGKLPRPLGYGVSVTHGNGVICVGGSDAERHYADAFRLEWKEGKLITTALPALPKPLANACGALVGDVLYVAGGQEKPDGPTTFAAHRIDLAAKEPKWELLPPIPGGGRMLSVAAASRDGFYVVSGVDLVVVPGGQPERKSLKDAYCYAPGGGWKKIADLPRPVVAAPSPASDDVAGFFVLGGDDGTQIGVDPTKHKGFSKSVLRYAAKTNRWVEAGELVAPRVTVPCVEWEKRWVIPGGEVRPGVRSPSVATFVPAK